MKLCSPSESQSADVEGLLSPQLKLNKTDKHLHFSTVESLNEPSTPKFEKNETDKLPRSSTVENSNEKKLSPNFNSTVIFSPKNQSDYSGPECITSAPLEEKASAKSQVKKKLFNESPPLKEKRIKTILPVKSSTVEKSNTENFLLNLNLTPTSISKENSDVVESSIPEENTSAQNTSPRDSFSNLIISENAASNHR